MSREFDLVIFGATGFTGLLACEYLAKRYGESDIKWAICGRSEEKLQQAKAHLVKNVGEWCANIPTVIADSSSPDSLAALCQQTKVVLSTVGPYKAYGTPLVDACANYGTDYCDITGESPWVRNMIERYHDRAVETGARLVSFCGYDSIPSDLGTFALVDYARKKGANLGPVTHLAGKSRGGFSGGTAASLTLIFEGDQDKGNSMKMVRSDQYALCPPEGKTNVDKGLSYLPGKDQITGKWRAPFIMAETNCQVVRRSAWANAYGNDFSYSEYMLTNSFMQASSVSCSVAFVGLILSFKPTRNLARRFLPKQGTGPSEKQRESGFFNSYLHSIIGEKDIICHVHAQGDPGYKSTSVMVIESALALVKSRLPDDAPADEKKGGYWTTSSCRGMGIELVERLNEAGIHFDIMEDASREQLSQLKGFL